jgi:hypothetical protein
MPNDFLTWLVLWDASWEIIDGDALDILDNVHVICMILLIRVGYSILKTKWSIVSWMTASLVWIIHCPLNYLSVSGKLSCFHNRSTQLLQFNIRSQAVLTAEDFAIQDSFSWQNSFSSSSINENTARNVHDIMFLIRLIICNIRSLVNQVHSHVLETANGEGNWSKTLDL